MLHDKNEFGALPAGTVEALLQDPAGAPADILLCHAVGAGAFSSDLSNGHFIGGVTAGAPFFIIFN